VSKLCSSPPRPPEARAAASLRPLATPSSRHSALSPLRPLATTVNRGTGVVAGTAFTGTAFTGTTFRRHPHRGPRRLEATGWRALAQPQEAELRLAGAAPPVTDVKLSSAPCIRSVAVSLRKAR